jgi:hypothetical protein
MTNYGFSSGTGPNTYYHLVHRQAFNPANFPMPSDTMSFRCVAIIAGSSVSCQVRLVKVTPTRGDCTISRNTGLPFVPNETITINPFTVSWLAP